MQTINLKQYYPFCTEDTFVGSYTPQTHRRRKVRFVSFPPYGENCTRSLAPPLPTKTAPLGFRGGPMFGLLRTSSAMGSYTPQTPCAPQATEHPQAAVPSPAA